MPPSLESTMPAAVASPEHLAAAHSLALLSEYTNTLDTLPLDLSRNFADLRELDAVLSASMAAVVTKINALIEMLEEPPSSSTANGSNASLDPSPEEKERRLALLVQITEEAARLKPGGDDKIRVACQAADSLRSHSNHLKRLAEHLPDFDANTLRRHTTYPHVAPRSYVPAGYTDGGRRRRGNYGSLLTNNAADAGGASPAKKRRVIRDDMDVDAGRSPRRDKPDGTARGGAQRKRQNNRAGTPDSQLSVTPHLSNAHAVPPLANSASGRGGGSNFPSSRLANGNGAASNKRAGGNRGGSSHRNATPSANGGGEYGTPGYDQRRDFRVPAGSTHPSLPSAYPSGSHGYDNGTWTPPNARQLEGPGMPSRSSHAQRDGQRERELGEQAYADMPEGDLIRDGDGGEGDADGDDNRTYCFCQRGSFGEMIGCDDKQCEIEWFHIACVGLESVPRGEWVCENCKMRRSSRRPNRGGKRRGGGGRVKG